MPFDYILNTVFFVSGDYVSGKASIFQTKNPKQHPSPNYEIQSFFISHAFIFFI